MADTDLDALCDGVVSLLQVVTGIGVVVNRSGGAPLWLNSRSAHQSYWEVDVVSASESLTSRSSATEYITLQVDGYMPFTFDERDINASIHPFRDVVRLVKRKLRDNGIVSGLVCRAQCPNLEALDFVTFPDAQKDVRVHHARITVMYEHDFEFDYQQRSGG